MGIGADVAIEAVGVPEAFEMCTRAVRAGGGVANIGVHGRSATLHLEDLWSRDITVTTGLVDTYSTPMPAAGRMPSSSLIIHRFELGRMEQAYDVFSRAVDTGALKVTPGGSRHHEIIGPAQP